LAGCAAVTSPSPTEVDPPPPPSFTLLIGTMEDCARELIGRAESEGQIVEAACSYDEQEYYFRADPKRQTTIHLDSANELTI
jgi:hypothetical protein